ncbi:MAG: hydrogenase maturation nickel metallochaperone HypA/HybF [Desulforhopalus sp.]
MHEISLVQGLFAQLRELADENNATRITSVTMEIGPLCGVVVDSFQFGFDILSADDDLIRGAKLIVKVPQVDYSCSGCGHRVSAAVKPDQCAQCGDLLLIPDGGDDLLLLQVAME